MVDTSTPIVVFGLSRGALHHGALGIARSGGRMNVAVHRVSRERWSPACTSRYSGEWVALPTQGSDAEILERLRRLARRIGRAVLVPVDDAGSMFVDRHLAALEADFIFPRQPLGLAQALSSKREMYELCRLHDIPTPLSLFPRSETEVLELTERTDFPIVAKCIDADDTAPSAPRVAIAADRDELLSVYRLMESPNGPNVMIQEYVPGTSESVWMFNGYFDQESRCRVGFTGKKIREAPPYTGVTTLGVCTANPAVEQAAVRLMQAVGYRGILDIDYRYDERDGQYKLLDVNPRIGGTFRLFVGDEGTDVLRAMYLDLTGQHVPASSLSEGRRFAVQPLDLASSITYHRRGDVTLRGWIRSFKGVAETGWFAVDDPLPFLTLPLGLLIYWLPRQLARR